MGPQIVYTVPYKPNPILRFMVRFCLIVTMIFSFIFTSILCFQVYERTNHGNPNAKTRHSLDSRRGAAR